MKPPIADSDDEEKNKKVDEYEEIMKREGLLPEQQQPAAPAPSNETQFVYKVHSANIKS